MTKLSDLLAQHEKIKQQIVEASTEEVLEIKERLEAISSATGKSVSELLGLKQTTSSNQSKAKASNPEWVKFKQDNDDKKFTLPDGKVTTVRLKGRNNAPAEEAWKAGTLKPA